MYRRRRSLLRPSTQWCPRTVDRFLLLLTTMFGPVLNQLATTSRTTRTMFSTPSAVSLDPHSPSLCYDTAVAGMVCRHPNDVQLESCWPSCGPFPGP
ncbi:hypothetical protein BDZ89DRAFT_488500 [Hymenopellis radicata]|nr:hypothetical protein BDZ89DRAFT_488500 [Hymenopellis radicata]